MRIVTFASGSSGNCCLVSDGKTNILIDAGISMRRIVSCLAELGLTPRDICGVLITHEHSDHISGLPMLLKHYGVKLYAPGELCKVLDSYKPEFRASLNYIEMNEKAAIGELTVTPFRTPHDSRFSTGYRIEGSSVFAYATDTGSVTESMLSGLSGADAAIIEANHDPDMLKNGPYPYYLKRRILSERGHLSNDDCGKLAFLLANSGTGVIILGHLSRENNTPELAYKTVKNAVENCGVKLYVAPAAKNLVISIGETEECLE